MKNKKRKILSILVAIIMLSGMMSGMTFAAQSEEEGSVPVKHVYNRDGVHYATENGWFNTVEMGDTPINSETLLLKTSYGGYTYTVSKVELIEASNAPALVLYRVEKYYLVWDEFFLDENYYFMAFGELGSIVTLNVEEYFEEGYDIEIVPAALILTEDPEDNVIKVYYTPTSEGGDTSGGEIMEQLSADEFKSSRAETILVYENGEFVIEGYWFFLEEYDYEFIITYDYTSPATTGTNNRPVRGGSATTTELADGQVPLTDAPVTTPPVNIESVDVPLVDLPKTGDADALPFVALVLGSLLLFAGITIGVRQVKRAER